MGVRRHKPVSFQTYKPEYGTNIVRLRSGKLISPARKEEKFRGRHWFGSKARGLALLLDAVKGMGAKFTGYHYLAAGQAKSLSRARLLKLLTRSGNRILVRSDNRRVDALVGQRERILQPRAVFPNTGKGRGEAAQFIRDLNPHYGVVFHHVQRPQSDVIGHGRVFLKADTGTVWVYFARRDATTQTFSRWRHKRVVKWSRRGTALAKRPALNPTALQAAKMVVERLKPAVQASGFKDVVACNFVIYRGEPHIPVFFDALFVKGLRRPGFESF